MPNIFINGIVSRRDQLPYLQIDIDGHLVQLRMADARSVARDIEVTCARTEADAMIHKFFRGSQFPPDAANELMVMFRDFRSKLDAERVDKSEEDPDAAP